MKLLLNGGGSSEELKLTMTVLNEIIGPLPYYSFTNGTYSIKEPNNKNHIKKR